MLNRRQVFLFQGHKIIAAPSGNGYFCRLCGVPCGKMARTNNVQTLLKNSAMYDPNRQITDWYFCPDEDAESPLSAPIPNYRKRPLYIFRMNQIFLSMP